MKSLLWNGDAFESCASVPVSDRGFRYGMAVFESIRVQAGEAEFLEQHLARLRQSCFRRAFAFDARALDAVEGALRAEAGSGFVRVYITAGDGAPGDPAGDCRIFLLIEQRAPTEAESYHLAIAEDCHHPIFGGLKTGCYWPNVDALQRARRAGKDEALLFGERAELISACTANVFVVHGGRVRTPATQCGARAGVIREWVMNQLAVEETSLFVADVLTADEIFLTNSWYGIKPAATCDGRSLPSRTTADDLLERFAAAVGRR